MRVIGSSEVRHDAWAVVGAIVVSLLTNGCVTKSAMMVGSAREILTGFREVQLAGPALQVHYTTKTWYGPSRVLESSPDRWTTVPFDSLPWLALDRLQTVPPLGQLPLECSVTHTTPEPARPIPLHGYKLPFKDWYVPDVPGYYTPVAAYVDPGNPHALMLVKVVDEQRAVTSVSSTTPCSFDRPWAPYARGLLVPLAVIADVVTSPFQAVYFLLIGMSH